jgi:transglutaminase-like putative cysteine protease
MSRRAREVETLFLTMFAALPLYFTAAIRPFPLIAFHAVMVGAALRVASGRGPELIPPLLMRTLAFAYIPFYFIDAAVISRSAIAASTHLVLFIAAYQPIEAVTRHNQAQRLLTTALIFIASLATSTHMLILPFVVAFTFLMFREMIYVSHMETVRSIQHKYALAPVSRAAVFYLAGTTLLGGLLFPLLPRLRNPVVQGYMGALQNATTGLSDSIDFNENRTSTPDPSVVARVWMGPEALPFFTPLRLKGAIYDRYDRNRFFQSRDEFREIRPRRGIYRVAQPLGFSRSARIQQRLIKGSRLFLPVGTFSVAGLPQLYEGPARGTFMAFMGRGSVVSYEVGMAREIAPLRQQQVRVMWRPDDQAVVSMAQQIVGTATRPEEKAAAVERHLLGNFRYLQRPEEIGKPKMSVEEFLLRERRGHCEYFAAGMVALLGAVDVPARIAGGFYGGRLNPLTGYFIIRNEDAHAWVEVWDGSHWVTYDPTPAALRPGGSQAGLLLQYATAVGDSVNYFWDRYILTYGLGDQITLFVEAITRARDAFRSAKATAGRTFQTLSSPIGIVLIAAIAASIFGGISVGRRRRSAFHDLARVLRQYGIEVSDSMTVQEALTALRESEPSAADALRPLVALYEEQEFSRRHNPGLRREIRKRLAALQP